MATKTKTIRDKELGDIFNQIIGAGKTNLNICAPKHIELLAYLRKVALVLDIFTNRSMFFAKLPKYANCADEFREFVADINGTVASAAVDVSPYAGNYDTVPEVLREEFSTKYAALKQCDEVAYMIKFCDNLIPYKKNVADATSLNHNFIVNMPGVEYKPFPWSDLNLKQAILELELSDDRDTRGNVELVMLVLNKLYNISHNIYRCISSPDVDINEFVDVVMGKIVDLRKRIPRCKKAFDKLVESVNLLKNNFGVYYRDFVETQTGTIIIENFVLDVAKNTKTDPVMMKQFRDIVGYIRKAAGNQVNNPQAKMLFEKLNEQFSKFDKYSNIRADGSEPEESSEEEEGPVPIEDFAEERLANANKSVDELAAEFEASSTK